MGWRIMATLALGVVACGEILGTTEETPQPPAGAVADAGAAPPDAAAEDATSPPEETCAVDTRELEAIDDVSPGLTECAGSIARGADTFANIGVGVELVKFAVPNDVRDAIRAGKTRSIMLSFVEDPAPNVGTTKGALAAHVLRNDWSGGTSGMYGGPDLCRRTAGNPGIGWGPVAGTPSGLTQIGSPADYGPSVGAQSFADGATSVAIALDAAALASAWQGFDPAGTELSFFVEEITASGRIVVATKDHPTLAKPRLTVEICVP